jgi:hypothetical protein
MNFWLYSTLCLRVFVVETPASSNKKAEHTKGVSFGSSAVSPEDPAAFRAPLTMGLALSGIEMSSLFRHNVTPDIFFVNLHF